MQNSNNKIRQLIEIAISIGLVVIIYDTLGMGCPFRFFLGVSCPGCGITRAWLSFFKGDLSLAFYYHPLFLTVAPMAVLVLLRKNVDKRLFSVCLGIYIIAMFVVYAMRITDHTQDIVIYKPETGLYMKVIMGIYKYVEKYKIMW